MNEALYQPVPLVSHFHGLFMPIYFLMDEWLDFFLDVAVSRS